MKNIWKIAAVAVLIGVGIAVKAVMFPPDKPLQFLTQEAATANITETVLATGTLEAFKQVSVGAQASGRVESLKVSLGDEVKKGDLIAEIDSKSQQNALRIAEANLADVRAQLASKEATLKQAESEYKRQKGMLKARATSTQDYESALATYAETKAEISSLNAQIVAASIDVDTARVDLGYTSITAPMNGVVVAIVTKEGQTVNAVQSSPTIVKLAQLDTMTVKADVSEADVVHVTSGQKVYFNILGDPDRKYNAVLRSIEPAPDSIESEDTDTTSSDDEAIYYNALFDVPNPDHKLRISMTAEVTIVLNEADNVLTIPEAALGSKDNNGLYTVSVLGPDNNIEVRHIKAGISDLVNVQVIDGIEKGERVVLGKADAAAVVAKESKRHHPMGF